MKKFKMLAAFLALCFLLTSCALDNIVGDGGTGTESDANTNSGISAQVGDTTGSAGSSVESITDNGQSVVDVMDKGPVKGGTLKLFTTNPDTFNPIFTKNSYVQDFLSLVYEGLTKLNEKQEAVPMLSDKWTVSLDGLTWTFHIRPGVKWHDGSPFTSQDVEFTVGSILNGKTNSQYKELLQNVVAFAAPDQENFKIVLGRPNSFLPELMCFPVLPKHQFDKKAATDGGTGFKPVGTGPFSFTGYEKDKKIELKANRNWWYISTVENPEKLLYVDYLDVMVYKSPKDAMNAFQDNDIDLASIDASEIGKYYGRTDIIIRKYSSRNFEFLSFNLAGPVTGDVSVRQAVNLAINKKSIIDGIFNGCATEADVPVNPGCWVFEEPQSSGPMPSGAAVTPSAVSTGSTAAGTTPGAILEAGGWKKGWQYYYKSFNYVRKELKLEILAANTNPQRVRTANMICGQLNASGIPATVVELDWDKFVERINTKKYDIAVMGLRTGRSPDISYLYTNNPLIANSSLNGDYAWNISGYSNAEADIYLQKLLSESDSESRKTYFKKLNGIIKTELPYIGICFPDDAVIYRRNVRGSFLPYSWNKFYDITKWYLPG